MNDEDDLVETVGIIEKIFRIVTNIDDRLRRLEALILPNDTKPTSNLGHSSPDRMAISVELDSKLKTMTKRNYARLSIDMVEAILTDFAQRDPSMFFNKRTVLSIVTAYKPKSRIGHNLLALVEEGELTQINKRGIMFTFSENSKFRKLVL